LSPLKSGAIGFLVYEIAAPKVLESNDEIAFSGLSQLFMPSDYWILLPLRVDFGSG